jgi:hypothetical protein
LGNAEEDGDDWMGESGVGGLTKKVTRNK